MLISHYNATEHTCNSRILSLTSRKLSRIYAHMSVGRSRALTMTICGKVVETATSVRLSLITVGNDHVMLIKEYSRDGRP